MDLELRHTFSRSFSAFFLRICAANMDWLTLHPEIAAVRQQQQQHAEQEQEQEQERKEGRKREREREREREEGGREISLPLIFTAGQRGDQTEYANSRAKPFAFFASGSP